MTTDDYRAVFEASPDGILVVDDEGIVRDANPRALALFGWSAEELLGREVEVLVPESLRDGHRGLRRGYMASPRARPMGLGLELLGRRRDGSEFPVEISLSPWSSDDGTRVVATVRDVSQRKRLREFGAGALRASEEERKRIARELHDDTAQQLATLLLGLRLWERDTDDETWLTRIGELRASLVSLTDGVRRIARGLRPPELEDAGVVAALRAHLRAVREGTGIEVAFQADAVEDLLDVDRKLVLYRVVQEAVSNVVRHAGVGRVEVSVARRDGGVEAQVRDRGRGFRGEGAPSLDGGGLGLVGMQERAQAVGGSVHIESEPGEGTTVRVELPGSDDEPEG